MAEHLLGDRSAEVRSAAALALGELGAPAAIPLLRKALGDGDPAVVLAAARALVQLHDEAGYQVYYEVLTGRRKTGSGLVATETSRLTNPRYLAKLGFREGLAFVPFAGMGWTAYKQIRRGDPTPIRAAAAKVLAKDPDPNTTQALERSAGDNHWLVRAAALEALAERGDASAAEHVAAHLIDENRTVRYTAAAAYLELRAIRRSPHPAEPGASGKESKGGS